MCRVFTRLELAKFILFGLLPIYIFLHHQLTQQFEVTVAAVKAGLRQTPAIHL